MRRLAVGRADLLRFLAAEQGPVLRRQAAALLGLPLLPASLFADPEPASDLSTRQAAQAASARLPLRCPVLLQAMPLPATTAPDLANQANAGMAAWSPADAADVEAMLALPGLAAPGHQPLAPRSS